MACSARRIAVELLPQSARCVSRCSEHERRARPAVSWRARRASCASSSRARASKLGYQSTICAAAGAHVRSHAQLDAVVCRSVLARYCAQSAMHELHAMAHQSTLNVSRCAQCRVRPNPSLERDLHRHGTWPARRSWSIIRLAGQAPCRLRPLSSNVRPLRSLRLSRSGNSSSRPEEGNGALLVSLAFLLPQSVSPWAACPRQGNSGALGPHRCCRGPTVQHESRRRPRLPRHRRAGCNRRFHAVPQPGAAGRCRSVSRRSSFTMPQA